MRFAAAGPKRRILLLGLISIIPVFADDFGFSTVIRYGTAAAGTWELGMGAEGGAPAAFGFMPTSHWVNGTSYTFRIGYTQSTNTAFLSVYTLGNSLLGQTSYSPAGGTNPTSTGRLWTVPASSFYVRSESVFFNSSVSITNLNLTGAGVSILQPLSSTSLTANRPGWLWQPTVQSNLTAPLVFRTTNAQGDWLLSGQITFAGTNLGGLGGASNNQLAFAGGFHGTDEPEPPIGTPEPTSVLLTASGFAAIAAYRHRAWRGKGLRG
jgi:hypothetical protein